MCLSYFVAHKIGGICFYGGECKSIFNYNNEYKKFRHNLLMCANDTSAVHIIK